MDVGIWVGALLVAFAVWVLVAGIGRRRRRRRSGADGGHRFTDAAVRGPRRSTIHWLRRLGLSDSAAGGRWRRGMFVRGRRRPGRDPGRPGDGDER